MRLTTLLILLPLLGGCAELLGMRPGWGDDPRLSMHKSPLEQVEEVLAYGRYVDGLRNFESGSRDALDREYRTMKQLVGEHYWVVHRVQLAWLLALPGSRFQDTAKALKELRGVREEMGPGSGPMHDLLAWMNGIIEYRRGLYRKLGNSRSRYAGEKAHSEALAAEKQGLLEENAELIRKINALADIESRIDERNLVP